MRNKIIALIAICIAGMLSVSCMGEKEDKRGYILEVGDVAPDFDIITADKTVKLSELRGKVVMLQFTATWCSVCIKEMPHIESDIWAKYKENPNFALYGLMYKQGADDAVKMLKLTNTTYPLSIDSDGSRFHKFAEEGAGVTRNVIIDKDGKIAYMTRLFNEEEFKGMKVKIDELMK